MFHAEKIPSAVGPVFPHTRAKNVTEPLLMATQIERYEKEIVRVTSVIESVLAKQEWLSGGPNPSISDLSFIPW